MGTKGSWTDFLLSKSSGLKASSLVAEHLVGAVGSAEKRVGEEKQSLKSPVKITIFWLSLCPVAVVRLTGLGVSEVMLVQRRNGN